MAVDFSKFDKTIDLEGLQADIQDAEENGGNFKDVPHGDYEVRIEKLELTTSKAGDPMLTCWFKVLAGEYDGSMIFYNQVVTKGFQIHLANEFLRSLNSGIEIEFKSYTQYAQLILDVHEVIDGKYEYALSYKEGKKGFSSYEITEVFEVE